MKRGCLIGLIGLGLILFVFVIPGLGEMWALEAPIAVLIGWIRYPLRVLPKITIDWSGIALLAVAVAAAAGLGHHFCKWLWKGTGHEDPWKPKWTFLGLVTLLMMFATGMGFTGVVHQAGWLIRSPEGSLIKNRYGTDRMAAASLKTIVTAQADFRSNDRDGNGKNDFWRTDIAGLFGLRDANGKELHLIEPSVAIADAAPKIDMSKWGPAMSKLGYWFKALPFKGETAPDPNRWAACAYPDKPGGSQFMYIVSHDGVMYKTIDEAPPEVYPDDPLKENWEKVE